MQPCLPAVEWVLAHPVFRIRASRPCVFPSTEQKVTIRRQKGTINQESNPTPLLLEQRARLALTSELAATVNLTNTKISRDGMREMLAY